MRPVRIKPLPPWRGDVRTEVIGHKFHWTMNEVNAFIAQVAAEAEPAPEPPQPTIGRKICAGCGRGHPLDAYHRRAASPDGHERLCKRCASAAGRVAREKAAAGGKYACVSI
jgi:hypothetical protein